MAIIENGKTYFVKKEQYGKIDVDGKLLMPIKPDPTFEETNGEPEIGCCVRVVYNKTLRSPEVQIIKRVSNESQIIYG